jgi:phosphoribosyl 1,2-cyclic phosphodiesterase
LLCLVSQGLLDTEVKGYGDGPFTGGTPLLNVTFFGVRGSTPTPCDANRRYGGNTSCVALESPGVPPIALDCGTGLRFWGDTQPKDGTFRGAALVTHIHFDHVQGLPFFVPADRPGAEFDIYAPSQDGVSVHDAFSEFIRPPYFPVRVDELRGAINFHDAQDEDLVFDGAKVRVRPVPHVGSTNGYRVEMGGAVVAYISDHQMPHDGSHEVSDGVLELCDGADLVIHDAQYTTEEFPEKYYWGHCTLDYAVFVASQAGAKRLALFHHDPSHDDEKVDSMLEQARARAANTGLDEVVAAYEGLTIQL